MLDPQEHDPRRYNHPTADEVAVIIVGPEDGNEPFERDIVIQDRHTGRLQNISQHLYHDVTPSSFITAKRDGIRGSLSQVLTWPTMSICKPVIALTLKKGEMRANQVMMLLIVDEEGLQECHKLNTMPFNFRIEKGYSHSSFMPVG